MSIAEGAKHWTLLCALVAMASHPVGCAEPDDIVGHVVLDQSMNKPDVTELFDGGMPDCDPSLALVARSLSSDWTEIATQCELPSSWLPPSPWAPRPDPDWMPPEVEDYKLLLKLTSEPAILLAPEEGMLPDCPDEPAWYFDVEGGATIVKLCPTLCEAAARAVATAISLGCKQLSQ